ncbi:MAG: glycosyltransferase [Candidatus Cloacimonetes bacterium]|nr:glycosyltransferase [Candidatus Cloacimonadota bacterium]
MKKNIIMILEQDLIYPYLDIRPYKEAETLKKSGYDVDFLTWNFFTQNYYQSIEEYKGFRIFRLQYKKLNKFVSAFQYCLCFINTFLHIKKNKYDIIHCHDTLPLLCSFLAKIILGKKLVYDAHELSTEMGKPRIISVFFKFVEYLTCRYWDLLITTNKQRTAVMLNRYQITDINSIILNNYPKLDYYNFFNIEKKTDLLIILYQGEISKKRETDKLIKAFKNLKISYKLLLIGKCKDEMYFKQIIKNYGLEDKVSLLQPLVNTELHKIMKISHIGIISLDMNILNNELCEPNKLYEYLLFGMSVIMPNCQHFYQMSMEFPDKAIQFYDEIYEVSTLINRIDIDILCNLSQINSDIIQNKYLWNNIEDKLINKYNTLFGNI